MTLTVPEDIASHAHFPPVSAELQAEFDAWERASDEDMARFNALESNAAL